MKRVYFCVTVLLIGALQLFSAADIPNDFIEYWSASQLMAEGRNPYDPAEMQEFQSRHFGRDLPVMMWNPPWLPTLFAPVFTFEPQVASRVWLLVQLTIFWGSLYLLRRENVLDQQTWYLAPMAVVLFPCIWDSIRLGQIGYLFATATNFFVLWTQRRRVVYLVPALILSSFKPHLFAIFMVALIWNELKEKKIQLFVVGIITTAFLVAVSELNGGWTLEWLQAIRSEESDIVPSPQAWIGTTLSGTIRAYLLPSHFSTNGNFIASIMFGACLVSTVVYLMVKRPSMTSVPFILFLIILSVWLAPFGWFFDQTAIYLAFLFLLSKSYFSHNYCLRILLLLCLATILHGRFVATYHHELFMFLPIFTLLYLVCWNLNEGDLIKNDAPDSGLA